MKNLSTHRVIHSPSCQFTLSVALALTLFSLTVNAQTVVRYNKDGEITASGTDIGAVQSAPGAAEGDVIKVSDGAAFNTDVTDPVSGFTIESSTGNVVNVPVRAEYPVRAGYYFPQTPAAPVNAAFRNVSFTSAENYTSQFWRGDLNKKNIIGITIDGNVSFSNFKESVFDYIPSSTEKEYCPYIFWCNSGSSLTFSGNTTNRSGAAIVNLSELNGNSSFMTFTGNTARAGGAIYKLNNLTGENNTLEFSGNTAEAGGGAIGSFGTLIGSNNTLEFSGNTAKTGGAIGDFYFYSSGTGNILRFSENTAAKDGGAINYVQGLTGENSTLKFSNNTANGTGKSDGGGAIRTLFKLSGSGNTLEFTGNTAANNGGAILGLAYLTGSGNTLEFEDNTAAKSGGAIYYFEDNYRDGLTGDNNILKFSKNTANGTGDTDGGGAIWKFWNFSGSDNILDFSENTAAESGGAIYELTNLSGSGNTLTFTGNTSIDGGAIYSLSDLAGKNNTLEFSGNTAGRGDGGAIKYASVSGSYNTLKFMNNTAALGGAIHSIGIGGSGNTLEFTGNTATDSGAIGELGIYTGSNHTLRFTGNSANYGGAIGNLYLAGSGNTLKFEGNTATNDGGAIGSSTTLSGENNELTFTGNTAGGNGGAIYSSSSIEFNGNNTLTFTCNKAGEKGNDIYLSAYAESLSFSGGTYSFDGGIWLEEFNDRTGSTTISNGAKVTIAGRDDDSVNEYEFRDVALTANLTATLDDIEYLHGKFTVGENGLLTVNKNEKTATIKSSTNSGVLDLVYDAENQVRPESLVISSGRIDIQGFIEGTVDVESGATYSPGNSVGVTNVTGDVIIENGVILFEFGEYPDGDSNHDVLNITDGSFSIESGIVNLLFENGDVSLWSTEGAEYLLVSDDGFASETIDLTHLLGNYHGYFGLEGRTNGLYLIGLGAPVPEPSTWALLILGAAGLAYMRKRSRQ